MAEKKWVLVLLCDALYVTRTLDTIEACRSVGDWTDDIVVLVDTSVNLQDSLVSSRFQALGCEIRQVESQAPVDRIQALWKPFEHSQNYATAIKKLVQYCKFHIFDLWFKRWDYVFYIDAGMRIYGDLNRMKRACQDKGVFYAHSNGYPDYKEVGSIRNQFESSLDMNIMNEMDKEFTLDIDSFQSTTMIFHTGIIEANTIQDLYNILYKYPTAKCNDQGIFNLYFHCKKHIWKQLPLHDEEGFLYDFLQRGNNSKLDYLMLKHPLEQLLFR